jgi:putative transposase
MNNHPHFLIRTIEAQAIPKFFQAILQVYAYYFRNKYGHTGFLFQNRYKNYLIEKEDYLLDCARYIERNPLRAKLTDSLDTFRWSSYHYYAKGCPDEIIISPNPLYVQLAETEEERRRKYREYILQERPYDLIVDKGLAIG